MTKRTFNEYLAAAQRATYPEYRYQRRGQHLVNAMFDFNPTLALTLTDTVLDPFYDDRRLDDFLAASELLWDSPPSQAFDELKELLGAA